MLLLCPKKHALPTKISMIYFGELVSYLRCAQMSCSDLAALPLIPDSLGAWEPAFYHVWPLVQSWNRSSSSLFQTGLIVCHTWEYKGLNLGLLEHNICALSLR